MKKIHVKQGDKWFPVFCRNAKTGAIVTCADAPHKALPPAAVWADADLAWFQNKFANHEFKLINVHGVTA